MKKLIKTIFFIIAALAFLNSESNYAQKSSKELVFTKAMIDKKNSQVWFEIYNPASETIPLTSFRFSNVRSPNVLPAKLRGVGTINLKSNERLIICSDSASYKKVYGYNTIVLEIKILKNMDDDGFIAMNYMDGVVNMNNLIRFGKPESSLAVSDKVGDEQVLNFISDGTYFKRDIKENGEITAWYKTTKKPDNN